MDMLLLDISANLTNATASATAAAANSDAVMQQAFMIIELVGVALVGFFGGRAMDLDWLCMKMRQFLKQNFVILNIMEGDSTVYLSRIVNLENDVVNVDNNAWVIDKKRIFRRDKPSLGSIITKQDIRWGNQGAPNIFVGKDDLKAKPLDDPNKSILKPAEVGSSLNAWVLVKQAKAKLAATADNALVYTAILGLLMVIGFYLIHSENADTKALLQGIQNGSIPLTYQTAPAAHITPATTQPSNINTQQVQPAANVGG